MGLNAQRPKNFSDRVFPMCMQDLYYRNNTSLISRVRKKLSLNANSFIMIYAGNIGLQSDFTTMISSASFLSSQYPDFKLVVAGSCPKEAYVRKLASKTSKVIESGWLNSDELSALFSISQLGLISFYPVSNYLLNIPNKFPEYLSYGLAIMCGVEGEMGKLVRTSGCGRVYKPLSSTSLPIV